MYASAELSRLVKTRRLDIGLSQGAVARLCGLSRVTVNQVENGSINDLSLSRVARLLEALGLSMTFSPARPSLKDSAGRLTPVERAAKSASVSYSRELPAHVLEEAVASGQVPAGFAPHINAVLEDASVQLLAELVEAVFVSRHFERNVLWANLQVMAQELGSRRELWVRQ
jgi:transcriptional regulator with XRE-family HTH domain